jgi:hypothetical protein
MCVKSNVNPGTQLERFAGIDLSGVCCGFVIFKGGEMGTGVRVYFFDSDYSIRRIPQSRFDRLYSDDSDERFPYYAGKRVRCAFLIVEYENRMPVEIVHVDFKIIPFDLDGRIDKKEHYDVMQLAVNSIPLPDPSLPENVIDARPILSNDKYLREYTWQPTDNEIDLLLKMVFS